MNLSDLSIEGLTQLEARLAADLEMVKRVKALVLEYQKMGVRSPGIPGGSASAIALGGSTTSAPGTPPDHTVLAVPPQKKSEERLTEALATMKPDGFILKDLSRATYSPHGCIDKDEIKRWVKGMVRKGKVRVVEIRAGRIGSVYAAVPPESSGTEG